jgi:hypothetical protein
MEQNRSFPRHWWSIMGGLLAITAVLTIFSHYNTTPDVQAKLSGSQQQFLPKNRYCEPLICRFGDKVKHPVNNLMI